MDLIETNVPCPHCQKPLCNLCGFNGICQDCKGRLPQSVRDDVAKAVADA